MKTFSIITAFIFILTIGSCSKNSDQTKVDTNSVKVKVKSAQIVASSNKFGFNLLKAVNQLADTQNIFISPFSALEALSMTYNRADGTTKEEMSNVLGFKGYSDAEVNNYNQTLTSALITADTKVAFEVANSIWYRNDFTVLQPFIDVNQTYYNAEVKQLDFSSPDALTTINNWCSANTHNKIPIILDYIPGNAVMYLINAIYFKGSWMYQFDKTKTIETAFYKTNGTTVTHSQMAMEAEVNYYNSEDCQAVEIPYGDGTFNFVILLPSNGQTISSFISNLDDSKWGLIVSQFTKTKVVVKIPKFKFEFKSLLNDPLKNLGMVKAFGIADFSGIDGNRDLYISRVIHKTYIDLNEEGTEAAAVTAVEIIKNSIDGEDDTPPFFVANRPFVYAITEKSTGAVLFIGKVLDPTIATGELK